MLRRAAIVLFRLSLVTLLAATAPAAPPVATPAPASPAPKDEKKKRREGYVRFWNMLPRGRDELQLIKSEGNSKGEVLTSATPLNYYAAYQPLPIGRYTFKIVRAADPTTSLQSFDVVLREKVFVTFLAKPASESIRIELVDDTYDPAKELRGRLVIHQQFPNANVIVTSSAQLRSQNLGYGAVETLDGFPLKAVTFNLQATLIDGKRKSWSTEVDFRASRHASLIIMPDSYERFRVRLSADGQLEGN